MLKDNKPEYVFNKNDKQQGPQRYSPCLKSRSIVQNCLECVECISSIDDSTGNSPVIRIELVPARGLSPKDRDHTHCQGDSADTVVWKRFK